MSFIKPIYYHWINKFSENQRSAIIDQVHKVSYKDEELKDVATITQTKKSLKNSYSKWCLNKEMTSISLFDDILYLINKANEISFGYNLYPLSTLECLYNRYEAPFGKYEWHMDDSGDNISDVKLTAVVNLSKNNSYEGGEFQLNSGIEHTVNELTPGSMVVFRSSTIHRVLPITKGIRESLTFFIWGPKFV